MFFLNTSFIFYVFLIMLAIFGIFYVWRRIYGLESYSKILEKKISNLKKENKELHDLLNGTEATSIEDADVIMNQIFSINTCCTVNDAPSTTVFSQESPIITSTSETSESSETSHASGAYQVSEPSDKTEDPVMTIQNIIGLDDASFSTKLPVVDHNDAEIESVVSDSVGTYNRKKLSKFNSDKLKEICSSMNLPTDGTKNNLIDRILDNKNLI